MFRMSEAARAYHAEMRRLEGERTLARDKDERKLAEIKCGLDRMVDALADGSVPAAVIGPRMAEAHAEAAAITARLAAMALPKVVSLHPKAIEHYLRAVDDLAAALKRGTPHEAFEPIRALIHAITVQPRQKSEPVQFAVKGNLAALLNGKGLVGMVPRDRIELPTRGFSIHCSTD